MKAATGMFPPKLSYSDILLIGSCFLRICKSSTAMSTLIVLLSEGFVYDLPVPADRRGSTGKTGQPCGNIIFLRGRDSPVSIVRIQQSPAVLQAEFRQTHHSIPAFVSEGLENYRTYPLFSPETDKKASEGFARGNKTWSSSAKDYGINGRLPKGSPPIIPFPFAPRGHLSGLSFFPFFLLKTAFRGRRLKGKAN
ncbi:hypothetical protein [Mucilaginibacter rubeus]|uniref:Uncharacterized protein n=1 Tax=Mucilaginibacter rubeus TaxID=2027860 RepID=A0A5C1I2I1_9SPHI|nr:hypothetical protein [Mucilaginibacter rubeus]QEM12442.1 hypothetical protein DEO27_021270 [Mucilaginibacter rubeus]